MLLVMLVVRIGMQRCGRFVMPSKVVNPSPKAPLLSQFQQFGADDQIHESPG